MTDAYSEIEVQPWEDVLALHERKIQDQLEHLYVNSDFYQRRFDEWGLDPGDIGSLEEFREIPFTTKQDERDSQANPSPGQPLGKHQAIATDELNRTISSSGTTGKPTYFGLTESDLKAWNEVLCRFFYTTGIRPEHTVIFGVGQTMVPGGTPYFHGLTALGANVVPAGGGSTDRLLNAASDLFGDVFFSTVSHARYLIDRAPDVLGYDLFDLPIDTVVVGGEPGMGTPEIREEIREGWGADTVRECMGLGDVIAGVWAECEAEAGMHYVGQGHAHVELVDPETGEATAFKNGVAGELVYTPLGREATPLLRFRSGDHARVMGTDCACGRTSPRIRCVGRTDDMLIYKGMNVFPTAIRDIISDVSGATAKVRIVTPSRGKVQFDVPIPVVVERDGTVDRDLAAIAKDVITAVRTQLQVRVEPEIVDPATTELSEYKTSLVVTDDERPN
jgi:phenylacetate-CoA ligase/benzoylacetate-CoA ligase